MELMAFVSLAVGAAFLAGWAGVRAALSRDGTACALAALLLAMWAVIPGWDLTIAPVWTAVNAWLPAPWTVLHVLTTLLVCAVVFTFCVSGTLVGAYALAGSLARRLGASQMVSIWR